MTKDIPESVNCILCGNEIQPCDLSYLIVSGKAIDNTYFNEIEPLGIACGCLLHIAGDNAQRSADMADHMDCMNSATGSIEDLTDEVLGNPEVCENIIHALDRSAEEQIFNITGTEMNSNDPCDSTEIEYKFEIVDSNAPGGPKIFKLIGGVTGYEFFYMYCEDVSKFAKHGWCACAGSPDGYNKLSFTAEQMIAAFNLAGVEIK